MIKFGLMKKLIILLAFVTVLIDARADDRSLFGVKGDVKHLEIENSDDDGVAFVLAIDFDNDGNIEGINGVAPDIVRDAEGRIMTVTVTDEDEEGAPLAVTTSLTYDSSGRVATATTSGDEGSWEYSYDYDPATGFVARRTYSSMGESEHFTYEYAAGRDKNGNWISRIESADGAEFPLKQTLRLTYR